MPSATSRPSSRSTASSPSSSPTRDLSQRRIEASLVGRLAPMLRSLSASRSTVSRGLRPVRADVAPRGVDAFVDIVVSTAGCNEAPFSVGAFAALLGAAFLGAALLGAASLGAASLGATLLGATLLGAALLSAAFLGAVFLGAGRHALQVSGGFLEWSAGHRCAVLDDQEVKCWGTCNAGELGTGDLQTVGDAPGEMESLAPIPLE